MIIDLAAMLVVNSLLSPSPFTKRVASPVTMVTWHFMLTESTGSRSFAHQCNQDPRCNQQSGFFFIPETGLDSHLIISKGNLIFVAVTTKECFSPLSLTGMI